MNLRVKLETFDPKRGSVGRPATTITGHNDEMLLGSMQKRKQPALLTAKGDEEGRLNCLMEMPRSQLAVAAMEVLLISAAWVLRCEAWWAVMMSTVIIPAAEASSAVPTVTLWCESG